MWQSLKKIYEEISFLLQNSVFSIVFAVVFVIYLCCLVSFPASNPLTLQWHELWTFLLYFQLHAANQKKTKNINIWNFQIKQNTSMLTDGYDIYVWLICLPYIWCTGILFSVRPSNSTLSAKLLTTFPWLVMIIRWFPSQYPIVLMSGTYMKLH